MAPVQVPFRINYLSPEWQAIKSLLLQQREEAIQFLLNPGKSESEYHQWRGRALLANKLLELETGHKQVTD